VETYQIGWKRSAEFVKCESRHCGAQWRSVFPSSLSADVLYIYLTNSRESVGRSASLAPIGSPFDEVDSLGGLPLTVYVEKGEESVWIEA